jgi:hypothetical protein
MSIYRMRGLGLYDSHNRKVASVRGHAIFDAGNRQVAGIQGNDLYDVEHRIMMTVRGKNIYDADNTKVASLTDASKSIEGTLDGMMRAAMWYCFVR